MNRRYMMSVSLVFMTIAILLLSGVQSIKASIIPILVYSISQGGTSVIPQALIADYFGRSAFATISGFRSMVQMIGIIIGPIVSGFVYDNTGSYQLAFLGFAVGSLFSAVLVLMARPPVKSKL